MDAPLPISTTDVTLRKPGTDTLRLYAPGGREREYVPSSTVVVVCDVLVA
jgi:hypothetical protein